MKTKVTVKDIALVGMMVAIIEACKFALIALPNVELTSFWIIVFTLVYRKKILFAIPVFVLIEGLIFGFGIWWVAYLYTWPVLALVTMIMSKTKSAIIFALISGTFGLLFGFMCAIPYVFTGANLMSGISIAFSWWVAGIPWDLVHGVSNFTLTLLLFHPITKVMKKISSEE